MRTKIQKIIRTPRLILRPPRLSDAEKIFHSYARDPEVTRYVSWRTHQSVRETKIFIKACIKDWKSNLKFPWVITGAKDKKVIGMMELRYTDSKPSGDRMDIGYILTRSEWGKGYATEVLRAVLKYAFSSPHVRRVWAICDVDNPASARVMEKAGMVGEGRLKRHTLHPNVDSKPRDVFLYAVVR